MKNSDSKNTYDPLYFFGNSEAGKAAREVNWSQHPLGTPQGWPVSLKTTLGILFNARQAMFLFWGELKFGFYNDAQIPILGHARHPHVMGKTGLEIWPEVWEQFALPQINIAMMGESTWSENQLIPILRSSQTDDGYFSYGYSPVYTEDGIVGGAIVTCIETTGKVLAERNLKENEERLKIALASASEAEQKIVDVLECMSDCFIALDKDFKVLRVNRNQERISGLDRSQTVGKNHWDIWPKESIPKIWEAYHKVINERVPVRIEDFSSTLNIWAAVGAFPTPDNGIAAFFTDITVRKTAQIDYERSVDVSPAILWITDKDGSCNYLSKQWYEFTGQTPKQALGFGWLGATHPEDRAQAGKLFTEANRAQKPFYAEYRIKTKEGDYRWAIGAGNPRYDANKNHLGYAGTVLDIHDLVVERQKLESAERQLKFKSHKLEMIFKESPAAMALFRGYDFVFEKVNPQYQAIFPDRQLVGKPFLEACPEFVGMPFIGYLRNVFKTGESYIGIEEYAPLRPTTDGPLEDRYYDFSYHRINDAEGKPYGVYVHAIDVTERVLGRKMAEAREESLGLALQGGKLGAWSVQFPEGALTYDKRTRELHGILPDDDLGDIVSRQAHPDDQQKITDALDALIKGASVYDVEYRVNDLNGKCRWIHALGEVKRDQNGNLKTLTGVAADHTLQIDARKSIEESEFSARQIANSLPIIIWTADVNGYVDWYNDWWYEYLGLPRKTEWDDPNTHPMHPEDIEKTNIIWYQTVAAANPFVMEQRFRRGSDGQYRWHLSRGVPIFDDSGKFTKYIGGNTDIHDEKMLALKLEAAGKAAAKNEKNLQLALERGHMGIWQIDLVSNLVTFSSEAKAMFLIDSQEVNLPELINSLVHQEDREELNRVLFAAINERKPFAHQYRINRKDGQVRWLSVKGDVVLDDDGIAWCYSGTVQDVTEQVKIQTELQEARVNAERANETKTAFLANMSHEIRTPLGAILGFSSLLKERNLNTDERDQYVDTIVRSGNFLTRIIDDILDLAKVEAGKLDIEEVPFSLYRLATDAVDLFQDKTKEKDIYLVLNIEESAPSHICSDPTRLRQILVNLIGNAVKFTEKGGIHVCVRATPSAHNKSKIMIDVKDTGIGLTEEQQEKLFTPFNQADNSMTRKFGGTGLGLALSQRLSRALSGEILISEYKLGSGCTFTLTFMAALTKDKTLNACENKTILNTKSVSLSGLQVLVVDDARDNLFLVERLLTKNGATVVTAPDGEEGVNKALSGSFDVVLMDIQMPKLDGYQAKLALDKKGYKKPVFALTAHAMSDEQIKTQAAGFAGHLTKPLSEKELLNALAYLSRS